MKHFRHSVLLCVALVLAPAAAQAQQVTTGSLVVRVTDESGAPLPEVTVTVTSEQGPRSGVTNTSGRFLATYLTPGRYAVRAELGGFRPAEQRDIDVRLGQRIEIVIALTMGAFSDAVEVQGSSPVVDLSSFTALTAIEAELLSKVPTGRQLADTVYLAAGVSSGGNSGDPNPSISGGSGLENQYVVDGVNINHARYGSLGAFSSTYGALGSGVTYDFINEVQVTTGGSEAEFGQSTGGVVNVVTRSGSNVWRVAAFAYLQPEWLEGDRKRITLVNGAVNTTAVRTTEFGVTLGGPLVRDHAFVFVALDPQQTRTTFVAPDGFPLEALGETDRTRTLWSYAAKGTFQVGVGHRVEASFFGDPSEGEMGPQAASAMAYRSTTAFSALEFGGHNQTLRYQGTITDRWLLEASLGRVTNVFTERPSVDEWQVTDYTTVPATVSGGKGRYEDGSAGLSLQYHLKSAHLVGDHEIKYGASYEDVEYDWVDAVTGPRVTLSTGETTRSGVLVTVLADPVYGKIYRASGARASDNRVGYVQSWSFFAQDKFFLSRNVTLSAGVRWEQQTMAGVQGEEALDPSWAPRLGIIVDPTGTGRTKVYASAGYFISKIPAGLAILTRGAAGWRLLRADYYDASLTQPIPDGVVAGGTTIHLLKQGGQGTRYDDNVKAGYIRELVVGLQREVAPQFSAGLRYVYRDMPRILEDVGIASLTLVYAKDPAATGLSYFITNPHAGYPATVKGVGTFEDLTHRYQAVELTADKRFADNWTLLAHYRWSKLWGNYEGFFRNDNSQANVAQSSLQDFPTNDPTYTEIGVPRYGFRGDIRYLGALGAGPLPTDRPHQLRVYGAYSFDAGLGLGFGLYAGSGRPLTPMAANPVLNRAGEIPEAPRGAGIETEDGFRKRTPNEWSLDVHGDYTLTLTPAKVTLVMDIFNLFNAHGVRNYDQNTEKAFSVPNLDYGRITAYQEPRQIRLGVRLEL